MGNMKYCMFKNTMEDIEECLEAVRNCDIESENEKCKAKSMFNTFLKFCKSEGIIMDYDEDAIISMINRC